MERRKLLASAGGVVGTVTFAGCITGNSGDPDAGGTGEEETLPPMTDTETAASTATSADDSGDPTATTGDDGTASGGEDTQTATAEPTETATAEPAQIDFDAEVEEITKCGQTCRKLKYAIINLGQKDAPGVTVRIRIYTGGDKIWDSPQNVGDLSARSQRTGITRDIDVGLSGANKIKGNDGEIRIKLTPQSDGVSETFTFEATLDV
jgi:hypothetical protein